MSPQGKDSQAGKSGSDSEQEPEAAKHWQTPSMTVKHAIRKLRTKCSKTRKLHKRFKDEGYLFHSLCDLYILLTHTHNYSDTTPSVRSLVSGYEADISDASMVFSREDEQFSSSSEVLPELIDTSTVTNAKVDTPSVIRIRRGNVMRLWKTLAIKDLEKDPSKEIKCLTQGYIDYLGPKLNQLFSKYTTAPWRNIDKKIREAKMRPFDLNYPGLIDIFLHNRMSQMFELYYEFLNGPKEVTEGPPSEEQESLKRHVFHLYELLVKDYCSQGKRRQAYRKWKLKDSKKGT